MRKTLPGLALFATLAATILGQAQRGGRGGGQALEYKSIRSEEDRKLPNPYARNEAFFRIPAGRTLGSASAIAIDKDGKSIWIAERCGANICLGSDADPIWKFGPDGNFVKAFGSGQIVYPHGIHIDRDGNIWVADLQSNVDLSAQRGAAASPATSKDKSQVPNGAQIVKFSPEGKILMKLGTPGVYGTDEKHFSQPSDVITAPNGDIFVADGHDSAPSNNRIMKFDKSGKFIKTWGTSGTAIGQFDCPHDLAMDSQGRLFVADRGNHRIQIFDQEGNFIAEWKQFGRLSGIYIDKNDVLYGADSQSSNRAGHENEYVRGVHVGNARTGEVTAFIQDPLGNPSPWNNLGGTTGAEGVAVDATGIIYVSQVNPPGLARYTKK